MKLLRIVLWSVIAIIAAAGIYMKVELSRSEAETARLIERNDVANIRGEIASARYAALAHMQPRRWELMQKLNDGPIMIDFKALQDEHLLEPSLTGKYYDQKFCLVLFATQQDQWALVTYLAGGTPFDRSKVMSIAEPMAPAGGYISPERPTVAVGVDQKGHPWSMDLAGVPDPDCKPSPGHVANIWIFNLKFGKLEPA